MNKPIEKSQKHIALEMLFLVALICVTFYFLLRDCDIGDILNTIRFSNHAWLITGVFCMALYIFCGGASMAIFFQSMGERMGPLRFLKYHLIEFFFSAITPSSTGGQPMEAVVMREDGYKISECTAVLLAVAALYRIATVVLFFSLYLCNFQFLQAQVNSMWFLFALGLTLNIVLIVAIGMGLYARKFILKICVGVLKILVRMRIVKDPERALGKLNDWLDSFHKCAIFMRNHPWAVVKSFCVVVVQRVAYMLVPYCVYLALGLSGATVWQILGLQLLLSVSVEMIPLPGAVGVSESAFLILYDAIFGAQFVHSAVMMSRGISYYLVLVVSGLTVLCSRWRHSRVDRVPVAQIK